MSTKIIKPIGIHADDTNPFEQSLASKNLTRVPGTSVWVLPALDTTNRIRTGLDEDSAKVRTIADEEVRTQEYNRRKQLRLQLQERTGYDLNAATMNGVPSSPYFAEIFEEGGIALKDGDNVFNMNNAIDQINFTWLCETGIIAKSWEDYKNGKYPPGQVQFFVFEEDAEEKVKYARIQKQDNALAKLGELTADKRRKIAKLLGLGVADDAISEMVYNKIREYITLPSASTAKDTIDHFNKYALLTDEVIDVEYLVKSLLDKNIIRSYAGVIKMGDTILAKDEETFKVDLLDPKNNDLFESLKDKLKQTYASVVL